MARWIIKRQDIIPEIDKHIGARIIPRNAPTYNDFTSDCYHEIREIISKLEAENPTRFYYIHDRWKDNHCPDPRYQTDARLRCVKCTRMKNDP